MIKIIHCLLRWMIVTAEFGDYMEQKHTKEFLSDYIFLPPVTCYEFVCFLIRRTCTCVAKYYSYTDTCILGSAIKVEKLPPLTDSMVILDVIHEYSLGLEMTKEVKKQSRGDTD